MSPHKKNSTESPAPSQIHINQQKKNKSPPQKKKKLFLLTYTPSLFLGCLGHQVTHLPPQALEAQDPPPSQQPPGFRWMQFLQTARPSLKGPRLDPQDPKQSFGWTFLRCHLFSQRIVGQKSNVCQGDVIDVICLKPRQKENRRFVLCKLKPPFYGGIHPNDFLVSFPRNDGVERPTIRS